MTLLLMVLLTLTCLPDVEGDPFWPQPFWGYLPAPLKEQAVVWSVLLTVLATALVGLYAWWMSRRVVGALRRDPESRDHALSRYERVRVFQQFALFVLLGVALGVFGWGWAVDQFWRIAGYGLLPCAELMVIAPFFAGMVLSWLFFYDADRAAHQAAHQPFDLDPRESEASSPPRAAHRDFGGRLSYVLFQLRQKLALVLIPVGLLLAQKEFQRYLMRHMSGISDDWQWVVNFAGSGCVLLAFVAMPWAVRLALGLKPLPGGALRERLRAAAKRLGFRCSNFLVWNTRSGMGNAMVVGVLPWPRYVVFTDRLLEDFTPEEVEAVFGHEVGHVKHHHMLFYLGFLTLSMAVFVVLASLIFPKQESHLEAHEPVRQLERQENYQQESHLEALPLALVALGLVPYIFVVFGFVSRRCERQADVYGCRAVSCIAPDCLEHSSDVPLAARGRGLCTTGIRTFIRALEKVALVNGISRDRPGLLQSWQHSTIAKRVEFLQRVLNDRGVERTFQRRVTLVKWGLTMTLGLILMALLVLSIPKGP